MATTGDGSTRHAALFVERVTMRNFKGIEHLTVDLRPGLTLLVGRNNAGKSRILRALRIAVGGVPVERDDLTVGLDEPAEIDVVTAPHPAEPPSGAVPRPLHSIALDPAAEEFDESLQGAFGDELSLISTIPARQRYAWRTTIEVTSEASGARSDARVLAYPVGSDEWHPTNAHLPRIIRRLVYAELVDTRRDLDAELRQRGTAIRRILNDLQVANPERESLEQHLADLGDDILNNSETLQVLRHSLNSLERYVDAVGPARVDPVPRTLEELARTVGVSFDDGSVPLASRLHGSGVRSLASLLAQDVFYSQALGADGGDIRPHPVALIEEPEAHLHPHAILEVAALLEAGGKQVVATTHSPLLASTVAPLCLQLLRRDGTGGYGAIDFGPAKPDEHDKRRTKDRHLYAEEMERLKRLVERPFGELLFARAVVVGDGATERAFLPPILRESMGSLANGVSVIDSGGMNNDLVQAVIKFARHAELRLVVFADSDTEGRNRVQTLISRGVLDESVEVVWAGGPDTASHGSRAGRSTAIERMLADAAPEACLAACEVMGAPAVDIGDLLPTMKDLKGTIGTALAREFLRRHPYTGGTDWPEPLRRLTTLLREGLAGPAAIADEAES